jgi:cell filamentation protein
MSFYPYDTFEDPYSYRGSQCLKNRRGLRDPAVLQIFEMEMSALRAQEPLPDGWFGPPHYKRVHWHLFRDVYRWAGQYRTVRTAKGGHWFCYPEHIDAQMRRLFQNLTGPGFKPGSEASTFIPNLAEFLTELNAIHPFREGNGRAQLAFVCLLGSRTGHPFHLDRLNPESFMSAMIKSFQGDLGALTAELEVLCSTV